MAGHSKTVDTLELLVISLPRPSHTAIPAYTIDSPLETPKHTSYWGITPHNMLLWSFLWKIDRGCSPNTNAQLLGALVCCLIGDTVFLFVCHWHSKPRKIGINDTSGQGGCWQVVFAIKCQLPEANMSTTRWRESQNAAFTHSCPLSNTLLMKCFHSQGRLTVVL